MVQHNEHQGLPLKSRVKIVVGVVLVILAVIIMFQNTTPVSATILFWQRQVPLVVLLLLMLVIGLILGGVGATLRYRRRAKER